MPVMYLDVPQLTEKDRKRFWSKVVKTDSCWLFKSSLLRGYGRFGIGRGVFLAHRVALSLATGESMDGIEACHTCDNRACVRPDHLYRGDRASNMRDMWERGRANPRGGIYPKGERHHNAVLTAEIVLAMRARHAAGAALRQLAREYGIDRATATAAIKGRTWKHLAYLTPDEQTEAKRA